MVRTTLTGGWCCDILFVWFSLKTILSASLWWCCKRQTPYFVSSKPPILMPPRGALPSHVVWVMLLDDLYENHLFLMVVSRGNPLWRKIWSYKLWCWVVSVVRHEIASCSLPQIICPLNGHWQWRHFTHSGLQRIGKVRSKVLEIPSDQLKKEATVGFSILLLVVISSEKQ